METTWALAGEFRPVVADLRERHAKQAGTRTMIELLRLGPQSGWDVLKKAVEQALLLGCTDEAAVRHLLVAGELAHREEPIREIGLLERYKRPLPVLSDYDRLFGAVMPGAKPRKLWSTLRCGSIARR